MSLAGLFHATRDLVARDDIYALISSDRVYADLHAAPLAEPSKVAIFSGRDLDSSFARAASHPLRPLGARPSPLSVGCVVMWDGTAWKVRNPNGCLVGARARRADCCTFDVLRRREKGVEHGERLSL